MNAKLATPEVAATVMLLRDGDDGLEVFMIVRHTDVAAFSGALVFPGGKVDPEDYAPDLRDFCRGSDALDDATLGLRIAAVREAFEECGALLARNSGKDTFLNAGRLQGIEARWRRALAVDEAHMLEMCQAEAIELAIDALVPFAHWITPETQPRVFDTHFFLAAAPAGQRAHHDGHEGADSTWITPSQAVAEAEAGQRTVVFPTRMNLLKLARSPTVADAIERATRAPIITVQPEAEPHPEGRILRIPAAADYGATKFVVGPGGVGVRTIE